MEVLSNYSVIIVGSGVAGLYSALKISARDDFKGRILLVTKSPLGESNSRYAQGGMAGVLKNNPNDTVLAHVQDTISAGAGLCDKNVVQCISEESDKIINELSEYGIEFDCDINGSYAYTTGGAHSTGRVLHIGEDATGMNMISALTSAVKNAKNIDIKEKTMAVELLISENNECRGIILFDKNTNKHEIVYADNVVLALGGAGQVYKYTTNPYGATGDGIALAYNAGAEIRDMEFIQFHPTALALSPNNKNRYLISEALRGEGAILRNGNGNAFMSNYSERKELAPRDIVARAIYEEMKKENSFNVFLDATAIKKEVLLKRFPSIFKKCLTNGIDISREPIPVAPAAHYTIGGIIADIYGKTSISGLYAIGENASTCFHGANRLASNSLLECFVCADKLGSTIEIGKAADFTELKFDKKIQNFIKKYSDISDNSDCDFNALKNNLKEIMWNKVGIIRTNDELEDAHHKITELLNDVKFKIPSNITGYEYINMLTVSLIITKAALARKESRGAHYRSDYTQKNTIAVHSLYRKSEKIK